MNTRRSKWLNRIRFPDLRRSTVDLLPENQDFRLKARSRA